MRKYSFLIPHAPGRTSGYGEMQIEKRCIDCRRLISRSHFNTGNVQFLYRKWTALSVFPESISGAWFWWAFISVTYFQYKPWPGVNFLDVYQCRGVAVDLMRG
ncbi:hypothetical protein D3C76_884880 [compost metagenome]